MTDQNNTINMPEHKPILPIEQFPEMERTLLNWHCPVAVEQIQLRDQRIQELERQLKALTEPPVKDNAMNTLSLSRADLENIVVLLQGLQDYSDLSAFLNQSTADTFLLTDKPD